MQSCNKFVFNLTEICLLSEQQNEQFVFSYITSLSDLWVYDQTIKLCLYQIFTDKQLKCTIKYLIAENHKL